MIFVDDTDSNRSPRASHVTSFDAADFEGGRRADRGAHGRDPAARRSAAKRRRRRAAARRDARARRGTLRDRRAARHAPRPARHAGRGARRLLKIIAGRLIRVGAPSVARSPCRARLAPHDVAPPAAPASPPGAGRGVDHRRRGSRAWRRVVGPLFLALAEVQRAHRARARRAPQPQHPAGARRDARRGRSARAPLRATPEASHRRP